MRLRTTVVALLVACLGWSSAWAQFVTGHLLDPSQGSQLKSWEKIDPKALPVALDNRSQFGPVKNQGSCGSCVVFAATALLEGSLVRDGHAFRGAVKLAEQLTLDCASQIYPQLCATGSHAEPILGSLGATGTTSAPIPYLGTAGYASSYNACVATINGTTSANYAFRASRFKKIAATTVENIKQAIHAYGAVVTSLYVTQTFQDYASFSPEVIVMQRCNNPQACGWHAVVLVGWDDGRQAFIGRNSWGSGWGRSGHFYISYGEVSQYSASMLAVRENGVYVVETASVPYNYANPPSPTSRNLTVAKSGDGSGTVASPSGAISCGQECSRNYGAGSTVDLVATAAANSEFSGWVGACQSGTPANVCRVVLNESNVVIADFLAKSNTTLNPSIVGIVGADVAARYETTPVIPTLTLTPASRITAPITRVDNLVVGAASPSVVIDNFITVSGRYDRERNRDRFVVVHAKTMTLDASLRGGQVVFTRPAVSTASLNGLNGPIGAAGAHGVGEVSRTGNPGQPGAQGGSGETGRSVQYPQIVIAIEKLRWSTGEEVAPGEVRLRFDFPGIAGGAGGNGGKGGQGGNGAPGKIGATGLFGCNDGAGNGGKGGDGGVGGLPGDGGDGGHGADLYLFTSLAQNPIFQVASLSLAGGAGGGGGRGGDSGEPGVGGAAPPSNGFCGPGRAGVNGSKPAANLGTGSTGFTGLEGSYVAYSLKQPALNAVAQLNAPNYQGLWWNAPAESESGWGLNLAHQGDVLFATWFTYDATGKGWWLIASAAKTAEGVYTGTLFETRGPPFNARPFSPNAVTSDPVGSATLDFTAPGGPTFAYTVNGVAQTKKIARQVFGPLPTCRFGDAIEQAASENYQDIWWATPPGSESGWGINLTHQGDVIFATWFTYDTDGTPMWLIMTALETGPNAYGGTLYRTTGPPFSAMPFRTADVKLQPVGNATLTFADGNGALFTYTVNGVTQSKLITRQAFRAPVTVCR